jgi:hypothetical protein
MKRTSGVVINVEIRDSVPDRMPYEEPEAPEGAANGHLYMQWRTTALCSPATGNRSCVMQFVDARSNNLAYVGTRATGNGRSIQPHSPHVHAGAEGIQREPGGYLPPIRQVE